MRQFRRLIKLTKAYSRWVAAGRPLRTSEEIFNIYHQICRKCDKFGGTICNVCECKIADSGTVLNKIAWATECCPELKWGEKIEFTNEYLDDLPEYVKLEIDQIENEPEVTLPNAIKRIQGPCRSC